MLQQKQRAMSASEWEALPPRRSRRRPHASGIGGTQGAESSPGGGTNSHPNGKNAAEAIIKTKNGVVSDASAQDPSDVSRDRPPGQILARQADEQGDLGESERAPGGGQGNQGVVPGLEESEMDEASEAGVARDAALTAAVEARATMTRFSGGLTGGAGTDGDNFECELLFRPLLLLPFKGRATRARVGAVGFTMLFCHLSHPFFFVHQLRCPISDSSGRGASGPAM